MMPVGNGGSGRRTHRRPGPARSPFRAARRRSCRSRRRSSAATPSSGPHLSLVTQSSSAGERSKSLVIQQSGCFIAASDVSVTSCVAPHVAVEAAPFDQVDAVLRRPESFLVGHEERAVRVEADAVGGAEAGGEDLGRRAVLARPSAACRGAAPPRAGRAGRSWRNRNCPPRRSAGPSRTRGSARSPDGRC